MKIQLKRSNVLESGKAKPPVVGQTEYGELAVNYNAGDAVIFLKDSGDNIRRVAGSIQTGAGAPTAATESVNWYYDTNASGTLYFRDATDGSWNKVTTGSVFEAGDGIEIDKTGDVRTFSVVLEGGSDDGLEFDGSTPGKLKASVATASTLGSIKIGDGLAVDGGGSISIDTDNPVAPDADGSYGYWTRSNADGELTPRTATDSLLIGSDIRIDANGSIEALTLSATTGTFSGTVTAAHFDLESLAPLPA